MHPAWLATSIATLESPTADDDLPTVRRELERLLWTRGGWSRVEADRYEQLIRREVELLSARIR